MVLLVNGWHRSVPLAIHTPSEIVVDMILMCGPRRLIGPHRHVCVELFEDKLGCAFLRARCHHIGLPPDSLALLGVCANIQQVVVVPVTLVVLVVLVVPVLLLVLLVILVLVLLVFVGVGVAVGLSLIHI